MSTVWPGEFSALYYVNVPRVAWLAGRVGVPVPESLGDRLPGQVSPPTAPYYAALEAFLRTLRPRVASLEDRGDLSNLLEGQLVAFGNRRLRTRNYRADRPVMEGTSFTGDLDRDALVYFDAGDARFMMPFDPTFVTTHTTVALFRSGSLIAAGLCVFKDNPGTKDRGKSLLIATPLVLGLEDPGLQH